MDVGPDRWLDVPTDVVAKLRPTATDEDDSEDALTYTWRMVSGPSSVVFEDASSADTSVTVTDPGEYTLQLSVDDGELVGTDELALHVYECPSPRNARPGPVPSRVRLPL